MTQPVERTRRLQRLFMVLVLLFAASLRPPVADAKSGIHPQAVRAAELLREWQFEDARTLIGSIASSSPDAPESHYLRAEMAFHDGRYAEALEEIEDIEDEAFGGNVGALRDLVASTYAVTKDHKSVMSSGGHFQIFFAPGKDEAIVELSGEVLEAAYDALASDLGHTPPKPIRVELLGRPSDLAEVSTLTKEEIETTGTIALCKYGKLMVVSPRATVFGYGWMDTLTHEYVHYVVTQMSEDTVPVWLHEGLARYLQTRWREKASGKLSRLDEGFLGKALKRNRLIPFDDMHPSMAKLPSQEAAALAFAEVSTMVHYLHKERGNQGLRRIIELQREGKGARKAVAEVMGVEWKSVESGWKKYLRSARLPAKATPNAKQEIRFRKGEGSDDNVGLEAIQDEKARKHARLGGMLRARNRPLAALVEYEKAHAATQGSDRLIAAKLSRLYFETDRFEEAIQTATPLLDDSDVDAAPATTIGAAHLALGNFKDASSSFEVALRVSPFDPTVRCGLSQSYDKLSDKRFSREREACALLRKAR